ncbi:MAG: ABC transporter ATP-binding protein [Methyloversatilis sp.]|jgi:iron(III) transport system ATP-binding protein|nr:ABC transporter ATP-binding protein [Methyloversatilis sp.]MBP6193249.1 ABC transporter ATP-binding protein [Methyloversatilis sp.]MBP9117918.1 ABC transporter ATP-binding protein [Methyloversatilis sp.]
MHQLELDAVRIAYGQTEVVHAIDLVLEAGHIGCLLGPSGCGKTSVLRAIAGFERVQSGRIELNGVVVSSADRHCAPERRRVGMVFQDFALFPHLSVSDNVAFGLSQGSRAERRARAADMLSVVGLAEHADKFPHQLSGGQQQRVALARALAPDPELLLLDEPFSSLDVELRSRLATELRDILKARGITAILVTHDQQEAFAIADEIGVMEGGRLLQWDNAYNLYHRPVSRFVADFVGQGVFLPGRLRNDSEVELELGVLRSEFPFANGDRCPRCTTGSQVDVLLRPDDLVHDDAAPLRAEVLAKSFRGADFLYTLRLASGRRVLSLVPSHHNHAIGEHIGIRLDADHVVAFRHPDVVPCAT